MKGSKQRKMKQCYVRHRISRHSNNNGSVLRANGLMSIRNNLPMSLVMYTSKTTIIFVLTKANKTYDTYMTDRETQIEDA